MTTPAESRENVFRCEVKCCDPLEKFGCTFELRPLATGHWGALMWATLFGIAFVISFSLFFAAIAMDF